MSGSDYDDVVTVTGYQSSPGSVTVHLQQFSNGSPLSDKTVTLHDSHLDPYTPIAIYGRRGNDQLMNLTAAPSYMDGGPAGTT